MTEQEAKFWQRVIRHDAIGSHGESRCWWWTGTKIGEGYGQTTAPYQRAHVYSYRLHHGELPPDKPWVLHTCDTPSCVNPEHLFAGTRADNIRDMVSKQRQRAPCGERNGAARLTEAQVREMRYLFRQGTHSKNGLARRYGVSRKVVYLILKGSRWVGVEP